jgi:hypothetical protein
VSTASTRRLTDGWRAAPASSPDRVEARPGQGGSEAGNDMLANNVGAAIGQWAEPGATSPVS